MFVASIHVPWFLAVFKRAPASVGTDSPLELVIDVAVDKLGEHRRFNQFHFLAKARAFVSNFPGTYLLPFAQTLNLDFILTQTLPLFSLHSKTSHKSFLQL